MSRLVLSAVNYYTSFVDVSIDVWRHDENLGVFHQDFVGLLAKLTIEDIIHVQTEDQFCLFSLYGNEYLLSWGTHPSRLALVVAVWFALYNFSFTSTYLRIKFQFFDRWLGLFYPSFLDKEETEPLLLFIMSNLEDFAFEVDRVAKVALTRSQRLLLFLNSSFLMFLNVWCRVGSLYKDYFVGLQDHSCPELCIIVHHSKASDYFMIIASHFLDPRVTLVSLTAFLVTTQLHMLPAGRTNIKN